MIFYMSLDDFEVLFFIVMRNYVMVSMMMLSESVELNQLKHMKTNPGNGTVILFFGSVTVTIAAGSPKYDRISLIFGAL